MTDRQKNPWAILVVLCLGFFMILLDTTIVNIAIPSIIDSLKATLDQILWVLNAYILVYAVLLITAGRLGDLYGQRNLFAIGLTVFTLASAACGFAQDPAQLIAARVVQGVGGALLTPQSLAILTTIFPPEKRGTAFGIWGGVAGLAAIAGPTLGGLLVTYLSWRWIFFVNVPIGIGALVATFVIVPDLRQLRSHKLDLIGVALASAGLFGIVYGLIEGQPKSWGAVIGPVTIWELIGAGVVLLGLFLLWERRQAEPLIPLSLFANRNFTLMSFTSMAMAFGMFGLFLSFVIYLQSVLGMTPLQAGLAIVPMPMVSMVVAPIAGRLSDRLGGKYLLMAGLALFAAGNAVIIFVATPTSVWSDFLPAFLIAGVGMGMIFAPMTTVAMRNIQPQVAGAASGVFNTSRQLGGAIGSASIGALLENRLSEALKSESVSHATALPAQFRHQFIDGFARAAQGGLQVGRGQSGAAAHLPAGLPPQVAQQLAQLSHDVFVTAFVEAMKATLYLPVAILVVGSLSCLLIQRRAAAEAAHEAREAGRQASPAS